MQQASLVQGMDIPSSLPPAQDLRTWKLQLRAATPRAVVRRALGHHQPLKECGMGGLGGFLARGGGFHVDGSRVLLLSFPVPTR